MIIASQIVSQNPQIDGRITVCESHLNEDGFEYTFDYMAEKGMNISNILEQHVTELNQEIQFLIVHADDIKQQEKISLQNQINELQIQLVSIDNKVK